VVNVSALTARAAAKVTDTKISVSKKVENNNVLTRPIGETASNNIVQNNKSAQTYQRVNNGGSKRAAGENKNKKPEGVTNPGIELRKSFGRSRVLDDSGKTGSLRR
jgi:hypothetical protein